MARSHAEVAGDRAIAHITSRGLRLAAPAGPWLALLLAGAVVHALVADTSVLPLVTAGVAALTLGFTAAAWRFSQGMGQVRRLLVTATTVAVMVWLLACTMASPWAKPMVLAWLFGGGGLTGLWLLHIVLGRASAGEPVGELSASAAGRALLSAVGVDGAEMRVKHADKNRLQASLAIEPGVSEVEDVQRAAGAVAAALGAPRSGVMVIEDPDHAGRGEMTVMLRDVLKEKLLWPGPSRPGGTVWDPLVNGVYADGELAQRVIGDEQGAKHAGIQGTTGAGKSQGELVDLAELMTRREVQTIAIDTVKGIQTLGCAAPGLHKLVIDRGLAKKVMRRLRTTVITERTNYLGARGLKAWRPGCGLTWLHVVLEEASDLLSEDGKDAPSILKAARSAGISFDLSQQRFVHTEIDTTARGMLGTRRSYGVIEDYDNNFLPDEVTDAGANPFGWRDTKPGYNYLSAPGLDVARQAMPARSYLISDERMLEHAIEWGPRMDPLDQVTIRAFGELYEQMLDPMTVMARAMADVPESEISPVLLEHLRRHQAKVTSAVTPIRTTAGSVSVKPAQHDDVEDEDMAEEVRDMLRDGGIDVDAAEHTATDVMPAAEGYLDLPEDPAQVVSTEQAREMVAGRIRDRVASGGDLLIKVGDFEDLFTQVKVRDRRWFRKELDRLTAAGLLSKREGVGEYEITVNQWPDPAPAAAA